MEGGLGRQPLISGDASARLRRHVAPPLHRDESNGLNPQAELGPQARTILRRFVAPKSYSRHEVQPLYPLTSGDQKGHVTCPSTLLLKALDIGVHQPGVLLPTGHGRHCRQFAQFPNGASSIGGQRVPMAKTMERNEG